VRPRPTMRVGVVGVHRTLGFDCVKVERKDSSERNLVLSLAIGS
jgi:hypothetical protein